MKKNKATFDGKIKIKVDKTFSDPVHITGVGTAKLLGKNWIHVKIGLEHLERVLASIKAFSPNPSDVSIDLLFNDDAPLAIGVLDEVEGKVSGWFIAPRVESGFAKAKAAKKR